MFCSKWKSWLYLCFQLFLSSFSGNSFFHWQFLLSFLLFLASPRLCDKRLNTEMSFISIPWALHRKSSTFYISRYFIIGSNFFCSKLSNRLWCYIRLFCIICGIRCSIFIYLIHWKIWWGKIYFSFVAVEATCSIYETFYNWVIQEYESFSKNNFIILYFIYF